MKHITLFDFVRFGVMVMIAITGFELIFFKPEDQLDYLEVLVSFNGMWTLWIALTFMQDRHERKKSA